MSTDRKGRVVLIMFVKIPVLYGVGFLLLKSGLAIPALLAGFIWPLSIIVMKAMGRMVLKMDKAPVLKTSFRANSREGNRR